MEAWIDNNVVTIAYQTDAGGESVDREVRILTTTDVDGIVTVKMTQECLHDLIDTINQKDSK